MTITNEVDYEQTWNKIKGNWGMLKGEAKKEWGKLTDDDCDVIQGRREELQGRLQRLYGVDEAEAQRMMLNFTHRVYDSHVAGVTSVGAR